MIPMYGSVGALFNRLGKIGLAVKQLRTYQSAQYTNLVDPTVGLIGQFNNEPDLEAIVGDNYINIESNSSSGLGSTLQQLAAATANRMVYRDNPRPGQTLTSSPTTASLQEIVRQMKLQGATVLRMTVGITPGTFAANAAIGNGVLVGSLIRPQDGNPLEHAYAETLTATCTADSYSGGTTAGNESFTIAGGAYESDPFAFDWPLGSGRSGGYTAIAPGSSSSASGGNTLANGGFEAFTANAPTNWTLNNGTAGTDYFKEVGVIFGGSSSLRVLSDGSTLYSVQQALSNPFPQVQYSTVLWLRRDASASGGGTLQVDLCDQNGVVINDAAGTPNSFTVNLTQLSTNYAPFTGVFRTPAILPTQVNYRLHLTSAYDSGKSFYLDSVTLAPMGQLYGGGPYLNVHSGSVPFLAGDFCTAAVTNSRGAGGVLDSFQVLTQRLYPSIVNLEILLPSSATPSISDSLIG